MKLSTIALAVLPFMVECAVSVRYTAEFLFGSTPFPTMYCTSMYNETVQVPYERDRMSGKDRKDFVSQARWWDDAGFIDTFWWFIQDATIDPSSNLFIGIKYAGRYMRASTASP